jgi:hypothetical protein
MGLFEAGLAFNTKGASGVAFHKRRTQLFVIVDDESSIAESLELKILPRSAVEQIYSRLIET